MKKKTFLIAISIMLVVISVKSQTWVTQNVNPVNEGFTFPCLSVVDSNIVWGLGYLADQPFLGQYYYLSRTLNGGNNWITTALDTDWYVNSISALGTDTAWITTSSIIGCNSGTNYRTAIRKTTDGGLTWVKNTSIPFDSVHSYCDFMHFFNSNEGVAFGDPQNGNWEVFYTMDGGLSWSPADSITAPLSGETVLDHSQFILGDHIWTASSKGRVLYTQDKGHNWFAHPVDVFQYPQVFHIAFFNLLEGVAVRYNISTSITGNIYRTHNGGESWVLLPHSGPVFQDWLAGIFIVPGSHIIISNSGINTRGSSFSADSGAAWTAIDSVNSYGAIDGKDWNSLWAGQYSDSLGIGGIAKWDGAHLGIEQLLRDANISVYPNPCSGKLNIISAGNISRLEIINLLGQIVYQAKPSERNVSLQLDETGIYFIRVTMDKQSITKKIIVYK